MNLGNQRLKPTYGKSKQPEISWKIKYAKWKKQLY
jgi:hypothetical protein